MLQEFVINVLVPVTGAVTTLVSVLKLIKKQTLLSEEIDEITNVDGSKRKKTKRKFK